jgi:hypothetical protein
VASSPISHLIAAIPAASVAVPAAVEVEATVDGPVRIRTA